MSALAESPASVGVVMMSEAEARECVARIKANLEDTAERLERLRDLRGWEALGYKTWQECIKHEFQMSRQRAHQLLNLASVDRVLKALPPGPASTVVDAGTLTERHRRELVPLVNDPPERMAGVIERAAEARGDKKLRAEDLRKETSREIGRRSVSSKAEAGDFDPGPSDEDAFAAPPDPDLGVGGNAGESWSRSEGAVCGICGSRHGDDDACLPDDIGPADPYAEADPFDLARPHPDGVSPPIGPDPSWLNTETGPDAPADRPGMTECPTRAPSWTSLFTLA